MRVALINEGTYPYRGGLVRAWCHRLVAGLPEHSFHPVVVLDPAEPAPAGTGPTGTGPTGTGPTGTEAAGFGAAGFGAAGSAGAPEPAGIAAAITIPLTGRAVGPVRGPAARRHRRAATHAAVLLCRGMLHDTPHSAAMFRSALYRLAALAADGTHPLGGVPLAAVLLDAWRASGGPSAVLGRRTGRSPSTGRPWPALHDARLAAALLEQAVRALCVPVPDVDVCHVVGGGLPTLVALGAKWRSGIPYVLTEHELYLDAPLMGRAGERPAVRALLLRFLRALNRLGYAEAASISAPNERMRRWAMHQGAERELLRVIPPGVDPHDYPQLREEPDEPVVVWLGPDHELPLILRAFAGLRATVPDARLVVAGNAPPGGLPDRVSFAGPVDDRRELYARGRIVVLSGTGDSMPYPLIEAMICGRAAVCTDSGGLAAMAGMGAVVAPPGDPARLAAACAGVLTDARLRHELGSAARRRARTLFSLGAMLDGFRGEYARALEERPAPPPQAEPPGEAVEAGVRLPAPRTESQPSPGQPQPPHRETQPPTGETQPPHRETQPPHRETRPPRGETLPPREETDARRVKTSRPRGKTPGQRTKTSAPRGEKPAPRGEKPAPRGEKPAPRGETLTPRGETLTPRANMPTPDGRTSQLRSETAGHPGETSAPRGEAYRNDGVAPRAGAGAHRPDQRVSRVRTGAPR